MRRLRKANIEFEEQNAVLQRHIKDMYTAKERLEAELGLDEKRTQALHQHLLAIKHTLVNSLSSVPLPGQQSVCCVLSQNNARMKTDGCLMTILLSGYIVMVDLFCLDYTIYALIIIM